MTDDREWLAAWCDEPLSDVNKDFRREALATAFGLHIEYVERAMSRGKYPVAWGASMGSFLARDMRAWAEDHPNCSLNDPPQDVTHWATMRLD